VNNEASHYVKLFGGNKTGNLTFRLHLIHTELHNFSVILLFCII